MGRRLPSSFLDDEDIETLKDRIAVLEDLTDEMTAWELGFFESLAEKYEQHGKNTRLSDRQRSMLEKLYERLCR